MIVVIVKVWEPGNPAAGTVDEDVITGIYHGFVTEQDAINWIEKMKKKWSVSSRTSFLIDESKDHTTL